MRYNEEKTKRELAKLQAKSRLKPKWFHLFFFSFFILCLAYVIDEIASNFNSIVQSDVLDTFFKGDQGYTQYIVITTLCSGISFFTFFYRALADRFGRKILLVINTFGLAVGMFICFISPNVIFYSIGLMFLYFFIPCDTQIVYILELANPKRRALLLAISKGLATLGVVLVPFFYSWAKNTLGMWNFVFLIPACIGVFVGFLCLYLMRESPVFLKSRMKILKEKIKNNGVIKKVDNAEGGIFSAIKYMFKHRVLLWLFLISLVFAISSVGVLNFGFIAGYMKPDDKDFALLIYPLACAAIEILIGLFADIFGRKKISVVAGSITFISVFIFGMGAMFNYPPILVGICLGTFLGGYFSLNDMMQVICSEESPTNLRSSIMSLIGVATSIGSFIPTGILLLLENAQVSFDISWFVIIAVVPSVLIGVLLLSFKVPETYKNSLWGAMKLRRKSKNK